MFNATLNNLCVNFDNHFELIKINWKLNDSQHWVITGANGSGKSALAACLLGIGDVEAGTITGLPSNIAIVSFEAQAELIETERRRDDADILDVISEGTSVHEILNDGCQNKNEQRRLIEAFKFEPLLTRSFRKLSTGETRKVILIKALTSNADLLILDEPFEGLDLHSDEVLNRLLQEYSQSLPMILVLNRFDEIPNFVTNIAYIEKGELTYTVPFCDETAVAELRQLLHLKTSEIAIPTKEPQSNIPSLDRNTVLVNIKDGRIAYGDTIIFDQLNWQINPGQHWQVSGPNGSGKTCLLNLITGDHPQCYVNNIQLFGMQRGQGESIWDIKQHIGYVSSALQWEYKVSVSVRNAIISGFYDSIGIYQQYSDVQKDIANQWLALLGMHELGDNPFNQLSFGDQRLILIVRAMVKHPPLLILDEPCLGLDDLNRHLVLTLIEKICTNSDTTVLYVNHRLQDKIAGIEHHMVLGNNYGNDIQ
ncbi:MAG: molybdate ABC transporter ATP-binding protein ModF [Granulosicoccaceae bacterium]